jgi:hypothetical protein
MDIILKFSNNYYELINIEFKLNYFNKAVFKDVFKKKPFLYKNFNHRFMYFLIFIKNLNLNLDGFFINLKNFLKLVFE